MFEVFHSVAELHIRTNLKEEDVNEPTESMVRTHRIHGIIDMGYTEQWQYVRMSEGPPYFNLSLEALKAGVSRSVLLWNSSHLLCSSTLIPWVSKGDLDGL
jgi:hypothetical protein